MEKNYKKIPFDLDIANEILKGKREDSIVTRCGYKVRIYTIEGMSGNYPIIGEFQDSDGAIVTARWMNNGSYNGEPHDYDLKIEVDELQFPPFQRVIVKRDGIKWTCDFYCYKEESGYHIGFYYDTEEEAYEAKNPFVCIGGRYAECLPYTLDTVKLVGTFDNWDGNNDGTLKE